MTSLNKVVTCSFNRHNLNNMIYHDVTYILYVPLIMIQQHDDDYLSCNADCSQRLRQRHGNY